MRYSRTKLFWLSFGFSILCLLALAALSAYAFATAEEVEWMALSAIMLAIAGFVMSSAFVRTVVSVETGSGFVELKYVWGGSVRLKKAGGIAVIGVFRAMPAELVIAHEGRRTAINLYSWFGNHGAMLHDIEKSLKLKSRRAGREEFGM